MITQRDVLREPALRALYIYVYVYIYRYLFLCVYILTYTIYTYTCVYIYIYICILWSREMQWNFSISKRHKMWANVNVKVFVLTNELNNYSIHNRLTQFTHHFSDDRHRVKLHPLLGDPNSDYINANYIDVSLKPLSRDAVCPCQKPALGLTMTQSSSLTQLAIQSNHLP